jgi:hypothetical protein
MSDLLAKNAAWRERSEVEIDNPGYHRRENANG